MVAGDIPEAYEGFWFHADASATGVAVSGIPANPFAELLGGWNLIGPRDQMLFPENPDLSLPYYWTGRRYKTLADGQALLPFTGYLIFAKRPTSLTLGQ